MRFLADGPSVPDELLLARDQGRVIFFCGAGVSRARANLPDFFGLAEQVIAKLAVLPESPAYKLVQEARHIDHRVGIAGVISADRVFGLLERDFSSHDIEEAVASALKPSLGCDLSAHKTLLDLATTPEGAVRLVTTNFDRLFDDCGRGLQSWQPPRLPDPLRPNDLSGIIYLHGKATSEYTGAEGDGFVLSSSEFGRAYLSDGWATAFIREILGRYAVVFVGYTADDPPVQYLLEALRKTSGKLENAYAFQSGAYEDAVARWRHKGVEAIPYSPDDSHAALWRTLEAWAARARNSEGWHSSIIESAKKGPIVLQPHERGQVAHIVSTNEGAKRFCEGDNPPPAEWLCVFDPYRRFAKPGHLGSITEKGPYVDPFELYGLDGDEAPSKLDPEDHYAKREAPSDAWDAFKLNRLDRLALRDENLSSLRGHWAAHSPRLPPRIHQLGMWIAKVCDQPAAVWWAAHQLSIHKDVQDGITWELDGGKRTIHSRMRQAWRFLFEAWERPKTNLRRDWFDLKATITKEGWSSAVVRQLGEALRPHLSTGPAFWSGPKPAPADVSLDESDRLVRMDVDYPELHEKLVVPNDWCTEVTRAHRRNLELALTLEWEVGGYGLSNISPIVADDGDNRDGDDYSRTHGLSAAVVQFSQLFAQLAGFDTKAAQREFLAWSTSDDTIFARLRMWASGNADIVTAKDFKLVIGELSDAAFWDSYHQRDLLLTLSRRWAELSATARSLIERRLLKGPKRWKGEKSAQFKERRAWSILSRLYWLAGAGCEFSFKMQQVTKPLHALAPEWKSEYGVKAAESLESRGGWVRTKTDHGPLVELPLASILPQAKALSGRSHEDHLVEHDPFAGFVLKRPVRALSALTRAAKQNDFPEWAWRRFLNPEARKDDKPRFAKLIAERLASYPDSQLATIIRPAGEWLRTASANLASNYVDTFDKIVRQLIEVLRRHPDQGQSGIVRGSKEPDWTMEAINAPTGRIAESLFSDPRKNNRKLGRGFPPSWLQHIEALLALPGDLRRHTLVILFHNLNWFHAIAPNWTKASLLPALDGADPYDRDAASSGFLWGARVPHQNLYMRMKDHILALATKPLPARRSYGEIVAGMVLAGWGNIDPAIGKRWVSDEEMRAVLLEADDEFRSRILWQIENWATDESEGSDREWASKLPEFLRVWPRQISAKSPNTSARLCELAFSSGDQFPLIVDLILPLVTKIEREHVSLPELRRSGDNVIDRYPKQALALLYAVLPDNALAWPYGIDATLQRIGTADPSLNADERLIALKRRWDAR